MGAFKSDDDRAKEGATHRGRVAGGEIVTAGPVAVEFEAHQPTPPPTNIHDLIEGAWLDKLSARSYENERQIAVLKADVVGPNGDNGKIGTLKTRLDGLTSKAWAAIVALLSAFLGAMYKVVVVTRAFDAVEAKSEKNEAAIFVLQAQVLQLNTALLQRHRRDDQPKDDPP